MDIKVASPCSVDWDSMTGDARSRFCGKCKKNVYNLSEMSLPEAEDLIRQKEGKLCVRFFQRTDGTVLTADCPVGRRRVWRNRVGWVAVLTGVLVAIVGVASANDSTRNPFKKVWRSFVRLFEAPVQPAKMGEMCPPQ